MAECLRVFISSTAIDLKDHRKAAEDAILRLEHLPIGMEYSGATAQLPLELCKEKVLSSDVVVVIVAHRYGWVPNDEQGGDGKKSITWYEVEAALAEGIPVLAYLVDLKHPWLRPREQDLLVDAQSKKEMIRIGEKVKALKELRAFLESDAGLTRDIFTEPNDLAKKVVASLASIRRRDDQRAVRWPIEYGFHVYHPLQPATHFRGREDILGDLQEWWKDPAHADRVISLVAIGGVGKTAIAAEFLDRVQKRTDHLSGHVFLWSFYEDPKTDSFLYEACAVFAKEEEKVGSAGGRLARLERALRDGVPHLFILDGLERIQSEGKADRAFGELDDHQLKNFLRAISSGALGRTRALVTTRFKMTDLEKWENAGHKTYELEHLDEVSAVAVLKSWGVCGSDERLARLAREVGYHALSISVLGSYLHEFEDGDPDRSPNFDVKDALQTGVEGAKLGRILEGYAKSLPKPERDLLIRLSVFPHGVSVKILHYLVAAGGQIAGQLIGANNAKLSRLARKLSRLGLVFEYRAGEEFRFTAHPFLRDYFRRLIGVEEAEIHETVRSALAPSLERRPFGYPRDRETLDRYEELIHFTIGAGDLETAFGLYWNGIGSARYLGEMLGEHARGARILAGFTEDGNVERISESLQASSRSKVANHWGLHASYLGDLPVGERAFRKSIEIIRASHNALPWDQVINNLVWLLQLKGNLPQSKTVAGDGVVCARELKDVREEVLLLSSLASSNHLLGKVSLARESFAKAKDVAGRALPDYPNLLEAKHLLDLGKLREAKIQTTRNLKSCAYPGVDQNQYTAYCHYVLGLVAVFESRGEATEHLGLLRDWANRSGSMESILEGHHLASEMARALSNVQSAIDEAQIGLTLAEGCGFGLLAIKLLLSLSRAYLDAPDNRLALDKAYDAMERSTHKDCRYIWGKADAAHLCGVAHLRLGERERARRRLIEALELRRHVEHPEAEETQCEIDKL